MTTEPTICRDCRTAEQFLDEILPRKNPVLVRRLPRQWIFRGHADATWKLLPAALRAEKKQLPLLRGPSGNWERIAFEVNRDQIFAEYFTVREFFEAADQRGHPLPEDSQVLRAQLARYQPMPHHDELGHWPMSALRSTMALAQHYGLATRFLDWTFSPFVAAYFAASECIRLKQDERPERMAVWALRYGAIANSMTLVDHQTRLLFVSAPRSTNERLLAQDGLFTLDLHSYPMELEAPVDRTPLESRFGAPWPGVDCPTLACFTLPATQVPTLLRLLSIEGINAATVIPGLSGVVQGLLEREHWQSDGLK
jgi:FRG domain